MKSTFPYPVKRLRVYPNDTFEPGSGADDALRLAQLNYDGPEEGEEDEDDLD